MLVLICRVDARDVGGQLACQDGEILLPLQFPCGKVLRRFKRKEDVEQRRVEGSSRFAGVCGHFFFPLAARFDFSAARSLDMVNRDYVLLVELIRTLAVCVECAHNALGGECPAMCGVSSQIVMALRYHKDTMVRRALLYLLSRVALSVPRLGPGGRGRPVVDVGVGGEVRAWLLGMANSDPDATCRAQAKVLTDTNMF